MPEASVRNRIRQDGFDEELFEIYVTGSRTPPTHPEPPAVRSHPPPPDGKSFVFHFLLKTILSDYSLKRQNTT